MPDTHDENQHSRRDWLGQTIGPLVLAAISIGVGLIVARSGLEAVEQRHFELHWASGQPVGFGPLKDLGEEKPAALAFDDADAVRLGLGLLMLAILLAAGAGQLVVRAIAGGSGGATVARVVRGVLAVVALVSLAALALSLFPPWLGRSAFFYVAALYVAAVHGGLRGGKHDAWRGKLVFAFIVVAAAVGMILIEFFVAMALGFFAALVATMQLAILRQAAGGKPSTTAAPPTVADHDAEH